MRNAQCAIVFAKLMLKSEVWGIFWNAELNVRNLREKSELNMDCKMIMHFAVKLFDL